MKWLVLLLVTITVAYSSTNVNFVKNQGQVDSDILYYAQLKGLNILLKSDGFYYDFYKEFEKTDKSFIKKGHVVKLDFKSSNSFNVKANALEAKYNFIKGKDKSKWITNVPSTNSILLENVYENIDLKMYFDNNMPRYDLVVKPNADPSQIKFTFKHVENLIIENNIIKGDISVGDFISNSLYAYQVFNGEKVQVKCNFVKDSKGGLKFELGHYDKTKKLVINPIIYSTYMGWNGDDYITQVRTLDDDNYYVAGVTSSPDFPASEGAYQEEFGFKNDVFISKYTRKGVDHTLQVATFYGGSEEDIITKMKIGLDKNIYICGYTSSLDLPMKNSLKSDYAGGLDGFVCVLNPMLNDIVYSYYVGGSSDDAINDIEIVNSKVFFGGYSKSMGLKLTSAYQDAIKGEKDGILGASNSNGSSIEYLTFLGGGNEDEINGIDIDAQENIYWIATSNSQDWKTKPSGGWMNRNSAYDKTPNGNMDMVIGRFTKDAGILQMCTYFGGSANDYGIDVFANTQKNYYFVGYSEKEATQTIEAKAGLYQEKNAGGIDMIFGRLSDLITKSGGIGTGNTYENQDLEISTFIGEKGDDIPYDVSRSADGMNFLITGKTNSTKFPQINNEINKLKYAGKFDGFILEINNFGTNVTYSTYLGGKEDDIIRAGAYFPNNNFIYGGETMSNDLYTNGFGVSKTRINKDAIFGHTARGIFTLNGPLGGEKYCPNTALGVTWSKDQFQDGAGYNVYLLNDKLGIKQKLVDTVKANFYNWIVGTEVVPDSSYKILVEHSTGLYGISKNTFVINQTPKISSFTSSDDKVCIGDSVVLTASVDGVFKPVYNWKFGNTIVATSNSGTTTIKDLNVEKSGKYTLELVGECKPNAVSESVNIDVAPNTKITDQTEDLSVDENKILELSVTAVGGELEYKWFLNDGELSGQTNSVLKIEQAQKADEGNYTCQVKGRCGDVQMSSVVNVKINSASSVDNFGEFNKFYFDGNNVNAEVKMNYSGNAHIKIFDIQGKEVYNSVNYISQGTNKLSIPCNYNNGNYLFTIIANDNVSTYKFAIVK